MSNQVADYASQIKRNGFSLVHGAVAPADCVHAIASLEREMSEDSLCKSRGKVFAARNLIDEFEPAQKIWRCPVLLELLNTVLGSKAGLVRVLFFDKPSERSWVLPWHKDMTISVEDNSVGAPGFSKPTRKAGVDHFEAPEFLLEQMLTLRVHLDQVTDQNGPLKVIAGSHHSGKRTEASAGTIETVLADVGDVLAMRPLLSHSSGHTVPGLSLNRRILHSEFCGQSELPDGVRWHRFIPCFNAV